MDEFRAKQMTMQEETNSLGIKTVEEMARMRKIFAKRLLINQQKEAISEEII